MKNRELADIEFLSLLKEVMMGLRTVTQDNGAVAKQITRTLETAEEIEKRKLKSIESQRLEIEAIAKAIENIKHSRNPNSPDNLTAIRQLEQEQKQKEAQYSTTMGGTNYKELPHAVQDWTIMANTLTDAINRWIDFNTKMQVMRLSWVGKYMLVKQNKER